MKIGKLLPVTIITAALITSGVAFAENINNASSPAVSPAVPQEQPYFHGHHAKELLAQLPEDKRVLLHNAMITAHKQNEPLHEKEEKLHKELDALLIAPTFDKNTYLEKSSKINELQARIRANRENAFVSVASQYTAEERAVLVQLHQIEHYHDHDKGEHHRDQNDGQLKQTPQDQ